MEALQTYLPLEFEDTKWIATSSMIWLTLYVIVTYIPIPLKNKFCTLSRLDELDI